MLPDFDVLQEALADADAHRVGKLLRHGLIHALGLLHDHAPLQHEGVLGDRVVAVDQDRLGLESAVVAVQPVDHEGRAEVGGFGIEVGGAVRGAAQGHIGTADVVQVLRSDLALEDVLEVRRQT